MAIIKKYFFDLESFEKSLKLVEVSLVKMNLQKYQSLKSIKIIFVLIDEIVWNTFSHLKPFQENILHKFFIC